MIFSNDYYGCSISDIFKYEYDYNSIKKVSAIIFTRKCAIPKFNSWII